VITRGGQVLSANGSPLRFSVPNASYHVALRHRNHLGVMTATPIALAAAPTTVDLRSPATATWGTEASKTIGSFKTLWAGEAIRDGVVLYTGSGNDRDQVLQAIGGAIPTNTAAGYLQSDINLDGLAKYTGEANDRDPILANIGGVIPTNSRVQQLP